MKSAAVALQCSGAGAPEVVQHFYKIFFRVGYVVDKILNSTGNRKTWARIPAQSKASFFPQKDFQIL